MPIVPGTSTHRAWFLVFAAAASLMLVACSSSPSTTPTPTCGAVDSPCTLDADCCAGVCALGICGCGNEGKACSGASGCCPGFACVGGACTAGCVADGRPCDQVTNCCSRGCEGTPPTCGTPRCNTEGEACFTPGQCCAGMGCINSVCSTACSAAGGPCTNSFDCCDNRQCDSNHQCSGHLACPSGGERCDRVAGLDCCLLDEECSTTGVCIRCQSFTDGCQTDADCCDTLHCSPQHTCTCTIYGNPCTADAECCRGSLCLGGNCTCSDVGGRCTRAADCCQENCVAGICHPATCSNLGELCTGDPDCCAGKACRAGTCCLSNGIACATSTECCGDLCLSDTKQCGVCRCCRYTYLMASRAA